MYLKEIKTSGFKSFADKITITLESGITCIVGPNGSGKSNIVDAVRWVLGEQSVKSLRGDGSMSDVIFQGSKNRAPLNTAYVELVFDNSDHALPLSYTEVSIKRKVYRTGENEYFINNEHCRLKDIIDLLLDSGVGKSSFSIIGQGEVMKILSNQSEDRRQIFEEAAGILKYKKRKEEALKKLDKTHTSMERVEDIIKELEVQVTPLKRQSEAALKYKENKEALETLDIALMANDISNYGDALKALEKEKETLSKERTSIEAEMVQQESDIAKEKTEQVKLEKDLSFFQNELLKATEEVTRLKGELHLIQSTDKNGQDHHELKEQLRILLDEKQEKEKQLRLLKTEIDTLKEQLSKTLDEVDILEKNLKVNKNAQQVHQNELDHLERSTLKLGYQKEAIKQELERGGILPEAVRTVLETSSLRGICDTIGNLVTTEEKYIKAFDIASSSSKNFIIVEDEESAKEAIAYLKNQRKGRATFFPISVIKSRYIDKETKKTLEKSKHFLHILSDILSFDEKYRKIMENQFGNVLVATDMDEALMLAREIKHLYRIVTLDGDIIHAGGSMSGGGTYQNRSILAMKNELKKIDQQQEANKNAKERTQKELKVAHDKMEQTEKTLLNMYLLKDQQTNLIAQKEKEISKIEEEILFQKRNIEKHQGQMEGTLLEQEQKLLEMYAEKNAYKEELELKSRITKENLSRTLDQISNKEADNKVNLQLEREKDQQIQKLLLKENECSIQMDQLLNALNEDYGMTYENAKKNYVLEMDIDEARKKVLFHKEILKKIGMVNLEAIEEYERVKTRYDFLLAQKEDLAKAEGTLLEIMQEMDEVMQEEFLKTFKAIEKEFQKVFKELFHGGSADLRLTDEEHLLTTGIEIMACPPGKKLSTITLLSGGEKTLTAISLLFAILNVRKLPFCLFDEVEAALDEANVMEFGNYLEHYKNKTQFLIITHKKKTMEYADTLYGITMQESGVSKLVSVKLEDQEELI